MYSLDYTAMGRCWELCAEIHQSFWASGIQSFPVAVTLVKSAHCALEGKPTIFTTQTREMKSKK